MRAPTREEIEHLRRGWRKRQGERRHRVRNGLGTCDGVTYSGDGLDLLVRLNYLPEADTGKPKRVAAAISAMLADAARR